MDTRTVADLLKDLKVRDLMIITYEETKLAASHPGHFNFEQIEKAVVAYFKRHGEKDFGAPYIPSPEIREMWESQGLNEFGLPKETTN